MNTNHKACSTAPTNVIQQDANHPVNLTLKSVLLSSQERKKEREEETSLRKAVWIFFFLTQECLEVQFIEQLH